MKHSTLTLLLFLAANFVSGQAKQPDWKPQSPKREFRGAWVATIANIDYPKKPTKERAALREQYKNLLDQFKELGFNAVVFQVRPAADAFYPSQLAPWSAYLSGKQGEGIPDFDPLASMVEETHARGMEFHAWLNPFRATVNLDTLSLAPNHPFFTHRNWLVTYGTRMYFNPAIPEVRQYLVDVVGEIVDKYDVDAIHFDDYFYPYPIKDLAFPDSADYQFYGRGFASIADWRRSNVDALIEALSLRIKASKPNVKFGISPFGVWRNQSADPNGSNTRASVSTYDDLYADVLKWARLGWIDYLVPQIYWHIGYAPADYATLLEWWSARVKDCQLYIGQAAYKVNDNPEVAWKDPNEIPRQVSLNRKNWSTKGSIYFSARSVLNNPIGLKDTLRSLYKYPALVPEMDRLGIKTFKEPDLRRVRNREGRPLITWKPNKEERKTPPAYFVLYRFNSLTPGDFESPANILHVSPLMGTGKKWTYLDKTAETGQIYTYVVKAVNRQHTEGPASRPRSVEKTETRVRNAHPGLLRQLVEPASAATRPD